MALAARTWLGSGWLLLVVILFHALNPTASPLTKSSGSAFNGFTAEVALGPERGEPLKRQPVVLRAGSNEGAPAGAAAALAILVSGPALHPALARLDPLLPAVTRRAVPTGARLSFQARAPPLV